MYIDITENLRLRPLITDDYKEAVLWYQDKEILWYSENRTEAYDLEDINRMYTYLSSIGEVYVIEYKQKEWVNIGDVTLSQKCMPIIILPEYQSLGLGFKIINVLIERARTLKWEIIQLSGIYVYNDKSQRLFKKCGFNETHRDEKKVYLERVL